MALQVLKRMRHAARLLAGKGLAWAGMGLGSTLLLAVTEYMFAILLILFLFSLRLADSAKIPHWLPAQAHHISPLAILLLLLLLGIVRMLLQLSAMQSFHALLELAQAKFRMLQGYRMLIGNKDRSFSLSQAHLLMAEHIPKASDYIYHLAQLFSSLMLGSLIFLGMLALAWNETLLGILCLCAFGFAIYHLNVQIAKVAVNIPRQRSRLERILVRICKNWLLIRIMRVQQKEYQQYLESVLAHFRFSKKTFFLRNTASVLPPFFGILSMVIIVGANMAAFHTPAFNLIGFVYLFNGFSRNLVTVTDMIGRLNLFRVQFDESMRLASPLSPAELTEAFRSEKELFFFKKKKRQGAESNASLANNPSARPMPSSPPPDITLRSVCFTWAANEKPVFENFSLHIPAGSRFGIIGPNGCGKSTLLGIILGILSPSAGEVLVDGIPSGEYVRRHGPIAYVSEENFLIQGTIRDNLVYGLERQVPDEEIWQVLAMVRLDQAVRTFAAGWNHIIQENEEGLSSGQKQRLAMARALLRRPALLILDEASANLDIQSETELAEILAGLSGLCTMIIASHKPGILHGTSHVLKLKEAEHA